MAARLLTFGQLRAFHDGDEVDWLAMQRLRAALLTYLVVERRATRGTLTQLFWPDADPRNGRQALRQNLYQLQLVFEGHWLEKHGDTLRVTPWFECDAQDFDQALQQKDHKAIAEVYTGPFLGGVDIALAKPWETWVDAKRATYARGFRRACRSEVDHLMEAGDVAASCSVARAWVLPDPLDDEAQHCLIHSLISMGERSEAIRQFEAYERLLSAESLTPLSETVKLIEGIRNGAPVRKDVEIVEQRPPLPSLVLASVRVDVPKPAPTEPIVGPIQGNSAENGSSPPGLVDRLSGGRLPMFVVATFIVLTAITGVWIGTAGRLSQNGIEMIAVLPPYDISGQDAIFAESMHDAIIAGIAALDIVGVVPRSQIAGFRQGARIRDIARAFDADAILETTLFRAGNVMRINVQLVEPRNVQHYWSESVTMDVQDVLGAQDAVVRQINIRIRALLSGQTAGPALESGRSDK